jgi:hypothetical protein
MTKSHFRKFCLSEYNSRCPDPGFKRLLDFFSRITQCTYVVQLVLALRSFFTYVMLYSVHQAEKCATWRLNIVLWMREIANRRGLLEFCLILKSEIIDCLLERSLLNLTRFVDQCSALLH